MQNLQNDLIELLKHEDSLVIDGQLNKNKIVEMALQVAPKLIKLLLQHDTFKNHFFTDVEGVMVFDKIKFQRFVNNKSFLPDSYTAFKNKIGLTINDGTTDNYINTKNDVVLAWPHKDCVLEGGQTKEEQKRNEIFWNETLAPDEVDRLLDPKVFTNWKKYDQQGEHEVAEITSNDNLIIKGNNLLALSSLTKRKEISGKVKLIYIDPPYNTGNDGFRYNDSFNHATWLTFMRNRLLIAKELLHPSGVIFIHLDYNELHYCKVLMDEIFGKERFQNEIVWRRKQATSYGKARFGIVTDSILFYSKTDVYDFYPTYSKDDENTQRYIRERFIFDDGDGRKYMKSPLVNSLYRPNLRYVFQGINPPDNGWLYSKERMQELFENGELIIPEDANARIYRKIFADTYEGQVIQSLWADIPIVNPMAKERVDFDTQKPEKLLQRIIQSTTKEGEIVLDFVAGSGTTLVTALKMRRRFVGIEQMDYIKNITCERLQNVIGKEQQKEGELLPVINYDASGISKEVNWQGGGSFIYCELAKYNQTFADQILEADKKEKLLEIWNEMKEKAFLSYQFDKQTFDERIAAFETLSLDDQKKFLLEVLDKNQLYVNYSEIDDKTYGISEADKKLNKQFYNSL